MKTILALDQGTTSSRAILFDRTGAALRVSQREFRQIYPQPGWVEHDATDILQTQLAVMSEVLRGTPDAEAVAIGITNQRETTILWDRTTGTPVANAIVWQDRRTAPLCESLRAAGHERLFRERTGLLLDPYFSGTKIRWILDHSDEARALAGEGRLAFGTVDTWLIWNLTGGKHHVTDVTNASRTMLFDIARREWDDELLSILGIPRSILPRVVSNGEIVGETAGSSAIPAGIPIAGVAGDQQAALFGQRCVHPGMVKCTYGTGSFIVANTGASRVTSHAGLLSTIAWTRDDGTTYAMEGSVFVAGAAVQWLRDELRIIDSAAAVEPLAASVPDSGGVVFVPAFTGLGAPQWDPDARGLIIGLTRGSTSAHLARAALEAIALQIADVLALMREESGIELRELRVDGGATANDLLMQIQADVAGIPVVRARNSESTALGAAWLAGLNTGFWTDEGELDAQWSSDRTFVPAMTASAREALRRRWTRAVERARAWND